MRYPHKFMGMAVSTLAIIQAVPALAQEAGGDASDIVVTARRVEERLQDVPISITVYNQAQISNRNITTASDLASYTPSLSSNNRFGSDKSSFTLRGFNQEGKTAPTVGVYFADVVALRSNSGTGGSNGAGPGSFFDLQNVQVLKGPQGTLFGRNTTGGAILLVPQKPTDKLEGYVEGSAGNYNMWRVQAVLNVPLADTFKVRLGIDRQSRDGYLHNKSGIGPKDFADLNYVALRGSIVADLTPNLENYLIATYSRSDTNGALFRLTQCQRNAALRTGRAAFAAPLACAQIDRQTARGDSFYDVENFVPDPFNITTQWQLINTTTWTASDAITVKNIVSYGEYRERIASSIGGENWTIQSGPLTGMPFTNIVIYAAPNGYSNIQTALTEEFQLQGRALGNRLKWQTGAYFEFSNPVGNGDTTYSQSLINCVDVYAFKCTSPFGAAGGLGLVYNKVANRNIGFYGQGTYEFSPKFAITAGIRYTIDRAQGNGGRLQLSFNTPNTVTAVTCSNPKFTPFPGSYDPRACDSGTFTQKSSRPTWLIDVEYKPINDVMLYAKYSRGYRQGGLDPSVIGAESWAPEKVDTYEIGAKTSFDGAMHGYFNLTGFYNNFTDQQLSVTATGKPTSGITGARIIVNAGRSRIWGIEADASITPVEGLKLDAGYTYLNTKLLEFVNPVFPATSPYLPPLPLTAGHDLPLSPHHRLTATATYTLPLNEDLGRLSVGATYVYTSSQIAADPNPFGTIPASNLVNLNLNWDSVAGMPVDLALFVTNLTKEVFPVNVANNWGGLGYESVVPNVPRMWGLRLKYRFGD